MHTVGIFTSFFWTEKQSNSHGDSITQLQRPTTKHTLIVYRKCFIKLEYLLSASWKTFCFRRLFFRDKIKICCRLQNYNGPAVFHARRKTGLSIDIVLFKYGGKNTWTTLVYAKPYYFYHVFPLSIQDFDVHKSWDFK